MRNITILFFLVLGFSLNAQTFTSVTLPAGAETKNLFSVTSFQDNYYIAGDNVLLKSSDFGDTWQIMYQSDTICFYDVEFYNNDVGYAIGMNKQGDDLNRTAHMFKTTDGGITWNSTHTPPEHLSSRITTWDNYEFPAWSVRNGSISVLNENRVVASAGSKLYFSTTGGRTYYAGLNIGNSLCTYSQSLDKTYYGNTLGLKKFDTPVYIGLSHEELIHSALVFDIDFVTDTKGFAVMEQQFDVSNLIVIAETGTTKVPISEVGAIDFYGLDFINSQIGFIVGESGTILKTVNSGSSFDVMSSGTTEQLNRIACINENIGIVVGNNGTILKTNDLGYTNKPQKGQNPNIEVSNWYNISTTYNSDFHQLEMETNNYYISGNGIILKSIDKGETWIAILENSALNYTNISFVNDNVGWIGGINSNYTAFEIYKTINAGQDWTYQTELEINNSEIGLSSPPILKAKDENTVLAVTASINVFKNNFNYSLDGGTTWDGYLATSFRDFVFLTNNEVLGVDGGSVNYLLSEDFSANSSYSYWAGLFAACGTEGDPSVNGNDIDYINLHDNTYKVFTCLDKNKSACSPVYSLKGNISIANEFQITGGGGNNPWSIEPTYIPADMRSIDAIDIDTVYMCGENGIIVKSVTGAVASDPHKFHEVWFNENSNTLDTLNDISFDGSIGIVIGNNGIILRTKCAYSIEPPTIAYNETLNELSTEHYSNYQWFYSGDNIAGSNLQTITPELYGSYSIVATLNDGCKIASASYLHLIPTFDISASVSPANSGTITGTGNYSYGETAELIATPETGYDFVNWTEDGMEVSTNANYSFTVNETRTLVANFELQTFDISASVSPANSGTITGTGNYSYGETADLIATPETGYDFVNWTENGTEVSTNTNYSFTVNETRTLVANFELQTFNISANVSPANSGTITGAGNYSYGETAELIATPETGYDFVNWTEDGTEVSTNANYSFTVNETRTLVANFDQTNNIDIIKNEMFSIYPNPTSGKFTIETNNSNTYIQIFDVSGKSIYQMQMNSNKTSIDLTNFENGIYLIHCITNKNNYQTKIIINK